MMTALIFLLVLTLVVLVHEAGHFFVAKWSGMKVYEFGWGFPPRAFGFYKDPTTGKIKWVKGSSKENLKEVAGGAETVEEFPATLYSVNWLPLGGFVKIKGENDRNGGPDSFAAKSRSKRLATLLAGVVMNYLLAAVLLGIGFMSGLPANVSGLDDPKAIIVKPAEVMVQGVEPESPAAKAEIKPGDIIVSLNSEAIASTEKLIAKVRENNSAGAMRLELKRGEEILFREATPVSAKEGDAPRLGVVLADAGIVRYPWYWAIGKGFSSAAYGLINIFTSFYDLIKGMIVGTGTAAALSGPVGIAVAVGESARLGFSYLINITAMISLSLAAMNVLPIPALDGGRALFVIIESLFGKRVPAKVEQIFHATGFVLLLGLILVITWRDIANLL